MAVAVAVAVEVEVKVLVMVTTEIRKGDVSTYRNSQSGYMLY